MGVCKPHAPKHQRTACFHSDSRKRKLKAHFPVQQRYGASVPKQGGSNQFEVFIFF